MKLIGPNVMWVFYQSGSNYDFEFLGFYFYFLVKSGLNYDQIHTLKTK